MLRVGLTGGIASGKSAVAAELRRLGVPVVDADELARYVVEPGQPAFAEIVKRFGPEVVGADGTLDRPVLGRIVFDDRQALAELEAITHPRVALEAQRRFTEIAERGEPIGVYEVPLLVEAGLMGLFDRVVVVAASPDIQVARVMERDGLTAEEAGARLAAQMSTEEKVARAHDVIWNEGTLDALREKVGALHRELLVLAQQGSS